PRVPVHGPLRRTVNRRLRAGDDRELCEGKDKDAGGTRRHRVASGNTTVACARSPATHASFRSVQRFAVRSFRRPVATSTKAFFCGGRTSETRTMWYPYNVSMTSLDRPSGRSFATRSNVSLRLPRWTNPISPPVVLLGSVEY